jgi:serine/threonine protein kinase
MQRAVAPKPRAPVRASARSIGAPPPHAASASTGTPQRATVGPYRILGLLGEGGAARTWVASRDGSDERFAIKELQLLKEVHSKQVQLFERECQVLQDLDHPQIPRFIETLIEERSETMSLFLVQECVAGLSLQQLIDAGLRITAVETVALMLSALQPLRYLHGRTPPLFHRDLKPSNLLLREDGQCVLIDFGAVREALLDPRAGGSSVVGTFGYMAPEQFHARAWAATDLYALGATSIHLLSGTEPARFQVRRLKPDFRLAVRVDDTLFGVLDRLLEPAAEDRYQTGDALRDELQTWYAQRAQDAGAPREVLCSLYERASRLDPALRVRTGRASRGQAPISLPGVSVLLPERTTTDDAPAEPPAADGPREPSGQVLDAAAQDRTLPSEPTDAPADAPVHASVEMLKPVERSHPFWLSLVPGGLGASAAGLLVLLTGGCLLLYGALARLSYNDHVWKISGAVIALWGVLLMLVPRSKTGRSAPGLRQRGLPAPAHVTRIERRRSFVGATEWVLHFDYFSEEGFIYSNCVRVPSAQLARQVAEQPDMVVVRYAPEDASRSILVVSR